MDNVLPGDMDGIVKLPGWSCQSGDDHRWGRFGDGGSIVENSRLKSKNQLVIHRV